MSFEKPNKNNVELDDLLILTRNGWNYDFMLVPIKKINDKSITATRDNRSFYVYPYEGALVMKKDKSFLIGERVPEHFLKSPLNQIQ